MHSKLFYNLWAKKEIKDHQQLWLPLPAHLLDAAYTINYLYQHYLNNHQQQLLAGNYDIKQLLQFLALVHDIGKATPAFQTKTSYQHDQNLDQTILNKINNLANLPQLLTASESPHGLAGEAILTKAGLNPQLASLIGGHHGLPTDNNDTAVNNYNDYTANYLSSDQNINKQQAWRNVQQELIDFALKESHYQSLSELPDNFTQPQLVVIEGLLIMADWLASSEQTPNEQPLFNLIPVDQSFDQINFKQRQQSLTSFWQDNQKWQQNIQTSAEEYYQDRFGFQPNTIQKHLWKAIQQADQPGIIVIEAPMGVGKTEMALAATEQLAQKENINELFFGLPTQVTTNAMFDRVNNWLNKIAEKNHQQLTIKLSHGKAAFNQKYQQLPNASNITDSTNGTITNNWFNHQKGLLVQFDIGTIDQLLMMSLQQKHLALRHLAFSGKTIVIDEVHAYSTYMTSYLIKALRWIGAYHVPVIVLSATLPIQKRKKLVNAYLKHNFENIQAPNDWDSTITYPLITYTNNNQIKQIRDFEKLPSQKVQIDYRSDDLNQLANNIKQQINQHFGVIGVILDTVNRAQQLAQLLNDEPIILLHSAFTNAQRGELENKLLSLIGKKAKQRPEKLIVIGTQVLEQSLDIDFDMLYTDLAPIDLIFQRLGRLHRHQRNRPKVYQKARCHILLDPEHKRNQAAEYIYPKYLLKQTVNVLPSKITLPESIAPIISKVYNVGVIDPTLQKNYQNYQLEIKKQAFLAKQNQIKAPMPDRYNQGLHHWLYRLQTAKNDDQIAENVRGIQTGLEVVITKGHKLINGQPISSTNNEAIATQTIRLPHRILKDLKPIAKILKEQTQATYPNWKNSNWLHYSIALILNENNEAQILQYHFKYNHQLGLIVSERR